MNLFQKVTCSECNMEYKIIWDSENFVEPSKCAGCGSDEIEVEESGFMA